MINQYDDQRPVYPTGKFLDRGQPPASDSQKKGDEEKISHWDSETKTLDLEERTEIRGQLKELLIDVTSANIKIEHCDASEKPTVVTRLKVGAQTESGARDFLEKAGFFTVSQQGDRLQVEQQPNIPGIDEGNGSSRLSSVSISSGTHNVFIGNVSGGSISYSGGGRAPKITIDGQSFTPDELARNFSSGSVLKREVVLRIPRGHELNSIIKTSSGDVEVGDTCGNYRINSMSGSVTVGTHIGDLKTKALSGSVTLGEVQGTTTVETLSGSIFAEKIVGDSITIESLSGSIRIISLSASGSNNQIKAGSSNISIGVDSALPQIIYANSFSGSIATRGIFEKERLDRNLNSRVTASVGTPSLVDRNTVVISSQSGKISIHKVLKYLTYLLSNLFNSINSASAEAFFSCFANWNAFGYENENVGSTSKACK